jgi:hypothetical protein
LQGGGAIDELQRQTFEEIVVVGGKFQRQLQSLYRDDRIPDEDDHLQERVRKACAYFAEKLQAGLVQWLGGFSFATDNKALRKAVRQAVEDLQKVVAIKTACMEGCREGFSTSVYLGAVAAAEIDYQTSVPVVEKKVDYRALDVEHPELLHALRQWRDEKANEEEEEGIQRYRILTRAVLRQIADTLPGSPDALVAIKGIGRHTADRYGNELLAIVSDYCERHQIDLATLPRPQRRRQNVASPPEGDTRLISYRLYKEGMSIDEIAGRRSLKASTIESHLVHYIGAGELPVTDFVSDEKIARIAAILAEKGDESLSLVKEQLGEDYSYGELKMVRAHLSRE